jgi:hypothetical protein
MLQVAASASYSGDLAGTPVPAQTIAGIHVPAQIIAGMTSFLILRFSGSKKHFGTQPGLFLNNNG